MNRTLSTSMLAAAVGAVILSAACTSGTSTSQAGAQPADAVLSAARELDPSSATTTEQSDHDRVTYFESIFDQLRQLPVLAPLFTTYSVPMPAKYGSDDGDGVVTLLRQVKITIQNGTVTITNRQTGGVIFTAPLSDLSSGVFHPENMPGGTTTTPSTCTSFTYSPWGTCTNGTQTRTVLTSSPTGCTGGTPTLTQTCTPAPTTCSSFTYSAWGTCQSNGTQTRTVLTSSPTGCTGGTPTLSQTCTYSAPNPVTFQNVVSSCTGCHGLTSNTTVFKSGGYSVQGRSAAQWLMTVNSMVGMGASLAPGTTAQNYADYLANVP